MQITTLHKRIREQDGNMIMDCNINNLIPAVYELPTIDDIFQRSILVVKDKRNGRCDTIIGTSKYGEIVMACDPDDQISIELLSKVANWSDGTPIGKYRPATKEEIEKMGNE